MTIDDLKDFRARHGMTQKHLAAALGVSTAAIRNWEAGRRRIPQLLGRAMHDIAAPKRNRVRLGDFSRLDPNLRRCLEASQAAHDTWHDDMPRRAAEAEARRAEEAKIRAAAAEFAPPKPVRSSTDPYYRPLSELELARVAELLELRPKARHNARPLPRLGCALCSQSAPLERLGLTLWVAEGWVTAAVHCPHGPTDVALGLERPESLPTVIA
ncbi:MAG: helix-turn-helix transcriptional regulator [Steroidobacteraceae bacterium]